MAPACTYGHVGATPLHCSPSGCPRRLSNFHTQFTPDSLNKVLNSANRGTFPHETQREIVVLWPTFVAFWVFHIAIRKDAEAVLRLMNSTDRLEVDRRLCSTTAITLCSRVSSSSARILDLSSSVRARVRCRSSLEFSSAILSQ